MHRLCSFNAYNPSYCKALVDVTTPLINMEDIWLTAGQKLVETDKTFLEYLNNVNNGILQHLVDSKGTDDKWQIQQSQLLKLNEKFHNLWAFTEQGCKDLQKLISKGSVLSHITGQMEAVQEHYAQYFTSFTNLVVIGGFDYFAKKTSSYWKENKVNFKRFLTSGQKSDSSVSVSLFRILHEQIRDQINMYVEIFSHLSSNSNQTTVDEKVKTTLKGLLDLRSHISQVLDDAALTMALWKSLGQKLTDALRTPERRLREDSRNVPLSLSAGKPGHERILLCDDVLVLLQGSDIHCHDLNTLWVEQVKMENPDRELLKVISPEEEFIFHTQEPQHQVAWNWKLNQAIRQSLAQKRDFPLWGEGSKGQNPSNPPVCRFATYTFKNEGRWKNASYEGEWLQGKPHGKGTLKWENEQNYTGDFKNGLEHGFGVFLIPQSDSTGYDCYKCHWSQGKRQRYGICEYSTSTVYRGYFKDDLRHGFGILESSRGETNTFRYVGHWMKDKKHGYGVLENMEIGETYIGMWQDDLREGCGIVVTQSGLCYEGTFKVNKLTGKGVLLSEDNMLYEGEFNENLHLKGKGKLTLSNGSTIEGIFTNKFPSGFQMTGVMKTTSDGDMAESATHLQLGEGLPFLERWPGIFDPYVEYLQSDAAEELEEAFIGFHTETARSLHKAASERLLVHTSPDRPSQEQPINKSEFIKGLRLLQSQEQLQQYLEKSLSSSKHPLGKLLQTQMLVFQTTYSGIGANKHLLNMAQNEVKYYADKILEIILDYIPQLYVANYELVQSRIERNMCPAVLPMILPAFYPELSMLYMLYHDKDDTMYWQGVLHLGLLSDTKLLEFLDVQKQLWPLKDLRLTTNQRYSLVHDQCFLSAIDCVQKISTTPDPQEKMDTLFHTLTEIERSVSRILNGDYKLPMDDLFPLLIYVISRARIRHLGSELHFLRDMMTPKEEGGIIDFLLTALESCYQHIQKEEIRQARFADFI